MNAPVKIDTDITTPDTPPHIEHMKWEAIAESHFGTTRRHLIDPKTTLSADPMHDYSGVFRTYGNIFAGIDPGSLLVAGSFNPSVMYDNLPGFMHRTQFPIAIFIDSTAHVGNPEKTYMFACPTCDATADKILLTAIAEEIFKTTTPDPLAALENLTEPNWDGYDADPITPATLHYARQLLRVMPDVFGAPDVAPAGDGSIALEWVLEGNHKLDKLFLDIGPGEEWRAYWMLQDGTFGRLPGRGFNANTKSTLSKLFADLST